MSPAGLRPRDRLALLTQNLVSFICAPLSLLTLATLMRWRYRWRINGHRELRKRFRREIRASRGPVLISANHLTMVDSMLILWALAPTWWYLLHFHRVPWNVPERRNFAHKFWPRVGAYLAKCIPVIRGGDRAQVSLVLKKLRHLLAERNSVLIFPEGSRSRTGRVVTTNPALGTGRLIKDLPDARVLCVYIRGDHQTEYSDLPITGERFQCDISWLEPRTDHRGLRGSVEISNQIMQRIQEMEERYFDDRQ